MFEFLLSIRVSVWLVRFSRMPRRCAATLPLLGKDISILCFHFCLRGGDGGRKGSKRQKHFLAHLSRRCRSTKCSNRLAWGHRLYKMWHRQLLCALSPSLQWYSHSLGASKLETGWLAPVIGGCMLHPIESRPS